MGKTKKEPRRKLVKSSTDQEDLRQACRHSDKDEEKSSGTKHKSAKKQTRDRSLNFLVTMLMKDKELQDFTLKRQADAQNGIVGLRNLGNTCYMNSSLQCLSQCYELTSFFLQGMYKPMTDRPDKNILGTEGRLVLAYAKLLNEMWNMSGHSVSPDMFKRILGQYAMQFEGFGQHDSHECINSILDLLGEDLYRHGRKPYVDMSE